MDGVALTWPGKEEARAMASEPLEPGLTLEEDPAGGMEPRGSGHRIVVGDNLPVARLLLEMGMAAQAGLVYIDPPYNTGRRFTFEDRRAKGQGRRAAWLSFMLPRLVVARELLADHGAMVVHIDEHEHPYLALLMDEVFGEHNALGPMVWDKRNPKGDSRGIGFRHETILAYAKDARVFKETHRLVRPKPNAQAMLDKAAKLYARLGRVGLPDELARVARRYRLPAKVLARHRVTWTVERISKEFGAWVKANPRLTGGEAAYCHVDEGGRVYRRVSMAWPNKRRAPEQYFTPLLHPVTGKPCPVPARGWRNPPETMERLARRGEILFGPDERTQPQRKYYLDEHMEENLPSVLEYAGSDDGLMASLGVPFANPKPFRLAATLVAAFSRPGDLVIDLFAGSGTTAHGVLEANRRDGGGRRFLLVQAPEPAGSMGHPGDDRFPTISDLCIERVRRVMDLPEYRDLPGGRGFQCLRLTRRTTV